MILPGLGVRGLERSSAHVSGKCVFEMNSESEPFLLRLKWILLNICRSTCSPGTGRLSLGYPPGSSYILKSLDQKLLHDTDTNTSSGKACFGEEDVEAWVSVFLRLHQVIEVLAASSSTPPLLPTCSRCGFRRQGPLQDCHEQQTSVHTRDCSLLVFRLRAAVRADAQHLSPLAKRLGLRR